MKPTVFILLSIAIGTLLVASVDASNAMSAPADVIVVAQQLPPTFTPRATTVPQHYAEGVATSPMTTIAPAVATYLARAPLPSATPALSAAELADVPTDLRPILLGALAIVGIASIAAFAYVIVSTLRQD